MLGTEEAELKNQVALWPAPLEISGIALHRGTFSTAYAKFNLMVDLAPKFYPVAIGVWRSAGRIPKVRPVQLRISGLLATSASC
jgi:hypothetical protein